MPLKPRNLKKLASLSAVGAGAIAITADKADASTVFVPLSTPVVVGFGTADVKGTSFTFKAFNDTFRFGFSRYFGASVSGFANFRSVAAFGGAAKRSHTFVFGAAYFPFRNTSYPALKAFKSGATFKLSTSSSAFPRLPVGARFWAGSGASTTHFIFGNGSFSHEFALFAYGPATAPAYGWVDLSFSMTDGFGPTCGAGPGCKDPNALGPGLTIWGYAYDTSGNTLPAGSLTPTPEPDTFAATGLAALALGALGMRRWRRKRAA